MKNIFMVIVWLVCGTVAVKSIFKGLGMTLSNLWIINYRPELGIDVPWTTVVENFLYGAIALYGCYWAYSFFRDSIRKGRSTFYKGDALYIKRS